jgi:hypothetical protein
MGAPALDLAGAVSYGFAMTKLLERALEAVRRLPAARQDEMAQTMPDAEVGPTLRRCDP